MRPSAILITIAIAAFVASSLMAAALADASLGVDHEAEIVIKGVNGTVPNCNSSFPLWCANCGLCCASDCPCVCDYPCNCSYGCCVAPPTPAPPTPPAPPATVTPAPRSLAWSFTDGSFFRTAPATALGIVVASSSNETIAFNATTGAVIWTAPYGGKNAVRTS